MKLLLFGGTFDPPHIGHMSILKNAIEAVQPDKVLVVPDYLPPHKGESTASADLRLAMCACFLPLFPSLVLSDMELSRGGKSYTIDTVQQLKEKYPDAAIYLCIGSDMLLTFTEWHRWQELLLRVTLVVQNRKKEDKIPVHTAAQELEQLGGRVLFAKGEILPLSSYQIRQAIEVGQGISGLVPPPADEIIERHRLYQNKGASHMTIEEAKKLARHRLSHKRYTHTKNVVKAAKELAQRFDADEEKAELAAWLHDIEKEESKEELLRRMQQDAIMAKSTEQRPQAVWHGPAAAIYARDELGVEDPEVLSAISCHTTGKAGMSKLDKVLFLADMVSAERDFPGVGRIRKLAKHDLDKAVKATLEETVLYLQHACRPIDEETEHALQDMRHID